LNAQNISNQLEEFIEQVNWQQIKSKLEKNLKACYNQNSNDVSTQTRQCLALAFFMNICRKIPGQK
jgi:hypothetical protein